MSKTILYVSLLCVAAENDFETFSTKSGGFQSTSGMYPYLRDMLNTHGWRGDTRCLAVLLAIKVHAVRERSSSASPDTRSKTTSTTALVDRPLSNLSLSFYSLYHSVRR